MRQKIDSDGVGKRVKELISFKNMSDSMFAKKVGIDTGNFNKKINGKQPWSINDINKICEKYMVRRQWLENGEGDMLESLNELIPDQKQYEDNHVSEESLSRLTREELIELVKQLMALHSEQTAMYQMLIRQNEQMIRNGQERFNNITSIIFKNV